MYNPFKELSFQELFKRPSLINSLSFQWSSILHHLRSVFLVNFLSVPWDLKLNNTNATFISELAAIYIYISIDFRVVITAGLCFAFINHFERMLVLTCCCCKCSSLLLIKKKQNKTKRAKKQEDSVYFISIWSNWIIGEKELNIKKII